MVDVFKSHVQDAFSFIRHPAGNLENNASDERFTSSVLNRVAIERQRKRLVEQENEKQVRNGRMKPLKSHSSAIMCVCVCVYGNESNISL